MPDRVLGFALSFDVRIGIKPYERHIKQRVLVDFEVETDWRKNGALDEPTGIVDYYKVNQRLVLALREREYRLIEAVAEDVARVLCTEFPVLSARVRVTKTPFDMPNCSAVAVECTRTPSDYAEG
jgi:7,8-dihydroneopterin aldolase/epimerase/oxygenase